MRGRARVCLRPERGISDKVRPVLEAVVHSHAGAEHSLFEKTVCWGVGLLHEGPVCAQAPWYLTEQNPMLLSVELFSLGVLFRRRSTPKLLGADVLSRWLRLGNTTQVLSAVFPPASGRTCQSLP